MQGESTDNIPVIQQLQLNIKPNKEEQYSYTVDFFKGERYIQRKIEVLIQLELGYLRLGMSVETLPGEEAQRIKLVGELSKLKSSHKFYILDEPTSGLHLADIQRLLECLNGMFDAGHYLKRILIRSM